MAMMATNTGGIQKDNKEPNKHFKKYASFKFHMRVSLCEITGHVGDVCVCVVAWQGMYVSRKSMKTKEREGKKWSSTW